MLRCLYTPTRFVNIPKFGNILSARNEGIRDLNSLLVGVKITIIRNVAISIKILSTHISDHAILFPGT